MFGCGKEGATLNKKTKNQIPSKVTSALGRAEKQKVDFLAIKAKAENGGAKSQTQTANNYAVGRGVEKDMQQALMWYQKAADQGEPQAQFNLGYMYYNGEVLPLDYRKAVEWFTKSAKQGNSGAQETLGLMYDSGDGVPENDVGHQIVSQGG